MSEKASAQSGFERVMQHDKLRLQVFPAWVSYDEKLQTIFIHTEDGNMFSVSRGLICPERFFIEAEGTLDVHILDGTGISVRGTSDVEATF